VPKSVLIVEDEAVLRRMLASALRDAGLDAVTAESAEEAERHLFPVPAVDLVVMDNRLPAADGVSVLRRLRAGRSSCPVILMTAFDQVEVRKAAQNLADSYLVKPFDLQSMLAEIERLLGKNGN